MAQGRNSIPLILPGGNHRRFTREEIERLAQLMRPETTGDRIAWNAVQEPKTRGLDKAKGLLYMDITLTATILTFRYRPALIRCLRSPNSPTKAEGAELLRGRIAWQNIAASPELAWREDEWFQEPN